MFDIEKRFTFEAGHQLKHHDGLCKDPHGHSYQLIISVRSQSLQPTGPKKNMVLDFNDLTCAVDEMIATYFDHKWLNESLDTDSPTSEYIAKWVFDFLEDKLVGLHSVTVCETENSKAIYKKSELMP